MRGPYPKSSTLGVCGQQEVGVKLVSVGMAFQDETKNILHRQSALDIYSGKRLNVIHVEEMVDDCSIP